MAQRLDGRGHTLAIADDPKNEEVIRRGDPALAAAGYDKIRRELARLIWHPASPQRNFDDENLRSQRGSLPNVDHRHIVIHNYRWRLGVADGEPQFGAPPRPLDASLDMDALADNGAVADGDRGSERA